jgi:hypothetical protein
VAFDSPRTVCIWAVALLFFLTRRLTLPGRTRPFRRFLLDTRLTMIIAPFNTAGFSGSLLSASLRRRRRLLHVYADASVHRHRLSVPGLVSQAAVAAGHV